MNEPTTVVDVLPKDAIPPVYDPEHEPAEAYPGAPDDEVIVVEIDGDVRGYPIRYLNFHEIVDDEIAGTPIAVTWCPLCGSAAVFDRRVDGETLTFGVSGKLADDTLVMYDHETDSEWKQSLARGIAGEHDGTELTVLPSSVTTYEAFLSVHEDARILAQPGGQSEAGSDDDDPEPIEYDDDPYAEYFEGDGFGLAARRADADGREFPLEWLDPKTVVLGIEHGGDALGFPRPEVEATDGVATATVGGLDVVVFATDDGLHAFRDPGYDWQAVRAGFRGGDALWNGSLGETVDEPAAHSGEAYRQRDPLERLPAVRLFAYGWVDNHGTEAFYRAES
jgi:hypothetical protein